MPDQFQSLLEAILDDDRATVKQLLNKDASLTSNSDGCKAGIKNRALVMRVIRRYMSRRQVIEWKSRECYWLSVHHNSGKSSGSQPLHYAADGYLESGSWDAKRQVRMIELLLESGADIHAQDKNGATPLHRAVRTRCAAAVVCLLDAGSDATLKNKPGSTPFHLAVQNTGRGGSGAEKAKAAQSEIIQAFLERGISPGLKDGKGKSVLAWAKSDWIREILTGHGI
jgi:hypothetical protein